MSVVITASEVDMKVKPKRPRKARVKPSPQLQLAKLKFEISYSDGDHSKMAEVYLSLPDGIDRDKFFHIKKLKRKGSDDQKTLIEHMYESVKVLTSK